MTRRQGQVGYDGTTGRTDHGGRRTHIIQILRDSREPLSVSDVAREVGVRAAAARSHLESLVDAGLAERTHQARSTPGRPRVLYVGTLPNQTHERAQGYRVLAEALTSTVAAHVPDAHGVVYGVGRAWGRQLTDPPSLLGTVDEASVTEHLVAKMDALWFAPSLDGAEPVVPSTSAGLLVLHHCPFTVTSRCDPQVVCSLHAGLVNGTLSELGSNRRVVALHPLVGPHRCEAHLEEVDRTTHDEAAPVPIVLTGRPSPTVVGTVIADRGAGAAAVSGAHQLFASAPGRA